MIDPQDKQEWVKLGRVAERRFAGPVIKGGGAIARNPAISGATFLHDFWITLPADLKTIRTRFATAHRYGIDPKYAITLNEKDVARYAELHPHLLLVLDVDFGDLATVRLAALRDVRRAIVKGVAPRHEYLHRVNDARGNARASYVFDLRWFPELAFEAEESK